MPASKKISRKQAKDSYNARSERARKRDGCTVHSKLHQFPTESWEMNPGKSDVIGIDCPGKRVKSYTRNGKKVKGYYRTAKPGKKCGGFVR